MTSSFAFDRPPSQRELIEQRAREAGVAIRQRYGAELSSTEINSVFTQYLLGLATILEPDAKPARQLESVCALAALLLAPDEIQCALHSIPPGDETFVSRARFFARPSTASLKRSPRSKGDQRMTQQSIYDRLTSPRPDTATAPQLSPASETHITSSGGRILALAAAALVLVSGGVFFAYENLIGSEASAQNASGKQPQGKAAPQPQARPQQQSAPTASAPGIADPFTAHAAQAAIRTCASTYAALGKALTEGSQYTVQTQTGKTDADRRSVQGVVGMLYKSGEGYSAPASGIVFAAPNGQSCEGEMVRVVPFAQNCQAAEALLPKGSARQEELAGIPIFALPAGGQAILLPAGRGCVAISVLRVAQGQ